MIPEVNQKDIDVWAEAMYDIFRNRDDIAQIAKNTGLPVHWIKSIKEHLFFNQHILHEGIRRFHANEEIASSWERLYQGDFITNDIKLLEHEYFESKVEKLYQLTYTIAHNTVQNIKDGIPEYNNKGRYWNYPNYQ